MNIIAALFTDFAPAETFTATEEAALVADAQAGDSQAYERLLFAYGPLLRSLVKKAAKTMDVEEAQGVALTSFAEVLASHTGQQEDGYDGRLSGRLVVRLKNDLGTAQTQESSFEIPKRTFVRFVGIMNAARDLAPARDQVAVARELAPTMGMTVETFDAVAATVRKASSLTPADDDGNESLVEGAPLLDTDGYAPYDAVEDHLLIEVAFSAVDDEEARIVELAYGFRGTEDYAQGEPVPDGAIADVVGLGRATVQRRRTSALGKMRKALGVTLDA